MTGAILWRWQAARIAARAAQCAIAHRPRQLADIRFFHMGDFEVGVAHRQEHVGSGIAIGYRKDIEAVEVPALGSQPGDTGQHQALQPASIQIGDARRPLAAHLRLSMKR